MTNLGPRTLQTYNLQIKYYRSTETSSQIRDENGVKKLVRKKKKKKDSVGMGLNLQIFLKILSNLQFNYSPYTILWKPPF